LLAAAVEVVGVPVPLEVRLEVVVLVHCTTAHLIQFQFSHIQLLLVQEEQVVLGQVIQVPMELIQPFFL